MHVLTKGQVFGQVNYWHYSIEWQNRGLPHVHILIRLLQCINQNYFDEIMSAEIPNPQIEEKLHKFVLGNNYLLSEARRKDMGFSSRIHGDVFSNSYPFHTPWDEDALSGVAMDMEIRQWKLVSSVN